MARVIVVTCASEGDLFSPKRDRNAPIRLYSDRWVEDDIAAKSTGRRRRQRLSRGEARHWRKAAARNLAVGALS